VWKTRRGRASDLFFLFNHIDGLGGTLLGAYAATLAIVIVDLDGNRTLDDPLRAVQPADETGWALVSGRSTLGVLDDRPQSPPVARLSSLSLAQSGMSVHEFALVIF
jgi:hypothetical protein